MPSQTTTAPTTADAPSEAVQELLAIRTARIDAALAEQVVGEEARGRGDKKAGFSSGGRLANRTREIRETELDLACEGHEVEPFVLPATARSKKQDMPQAQIEASLAKLGSVYKTTRFEGVKTSADQRIQALLKAASSRGYTVTDPRK